MKSSTSLGLILMSIALLFFFGRPTYSSLQTVLAEKTKYEKSLSDVNAVKQKIGELTSKADAVSVANKENLSTLLPDSSKTTVVVADIDSMASRHAIAIDNISYVKPLDNQAQSVSEAVPKTYDSTIVNFSFTGSYENFKMLLSDMEDHLRLLDVRSIEILTDTKGVNNYKVGVQIYWLNPQSNEIK